MTDRSDYSTELASGARTETVDDPGLRRWTLGKAFYRTGGAAVGMWLGWLAFELFVRNPQGDPAGAIVGVTGAMFVLWVVCSLIVWGIRQVMPPAP